MKIVKRIASFVLRVANGIAVNAVKSLGVASFVLTLLIIAVLVGGYLVDRQLMGGYYSGYLIASTVGGGLYRGFLEFSYLTETYPIWCLAGVVAFFALVFVLKFRLRGGLVKRKRRYNILTNIAYVVLSTALNLLLIAASVALVLDGMLISYLRAATYAGDQADAGFWARAEFLTAQVNENRDLSSMALQKIAYDLNKEPDAVAQLTDEELLALCEEVNHLIDLQGGPRSAQEHFLRNLLNRAPATLADMVATIQAADAPTWILLPPKQSAYHMQGPGGVFHLKFISANGYFEAVYDRDGVLLTQDNDPVNMGTYNYANPVATPQKHNTYDVIPYYQWGNTRERGPVTPREMEQVFRALDSFSHNPEAMAWYDRYRRMLDGAGGG